MMTGVIPILITKLLASGDELKKSEGFYVL